jgi:hypothetical protein
MVVLLPLDGERLRACTRCPTVGLCSPTPERSSFYPRRTGGALYDSQCKTCSKAIATAYQRETGAPAVYARRRRAALLGDSEAREAFLARQRVYAARSRERNREEIRRRDAVRRRENSEAIRVDRRLARERKGAPLVVPAVPKNTTAAIAYPAGPFRDWLRGMIAAETRSGIPNAQAIVGERCGISDKNLRAWIKDGAYVDASSVWKSWCWERRGDYLDEMTIDRAVSAEGSLMLSDLYPAGALVVRRYAPSRDLPVAPTEACSTPGCGAARAAGRFCGPCSARLAALREEFASESRAMSAAGGATRRQSKAKRSRTPTCCQSNCWNTREAGQRFCPECIDDGWTEDVFE